MLATGEWLHWHGWWIILILLLALPVCLLVFALVTILVRKWREG
jgi:hypothetical protein